MSNRKNTKRFLSILFAFVIIISGYHYFVVGKNHSTSSNTIISFLEKPFITNTDNSSTGNTNQSSPITNSDLSSPSKNTQLPKKIDLEVPFTSQAPDANWDDLHNDGCEEASVISVIYYLQNKTLSKDQAEQEIQSQVSWQIDNFGGHYDLPIAKTVELVEKYYQRKADYWYDITIEQIKTELANGNPVIVPLAGRVISNPYYRTPGPVYHMLVIRGYDDDKNQFITNDVGTKRGESYHYDYQTLFKAIHDMPLWQQNKSILDANPQMIFDGKNAMMVIK